MKLFVTLALAVVVTAGFVAAAKGAWFVGLGQLEPAPTVPPLPSYAGWRLDRISDDWQTAVGKPLGVPGVVRWAADTAPRVIGAGDLDGWFQTNAYSTIPALSRNGAVLASQSMAGRTTGPAAIRWDFGNGETVLTPWNADRSFANAISADGTVIYGFWALTDNDGFAAFRWTEQDGFKDLGKADAASTMLTYDTSADGQIAIGNALGVNRGFRWSESTGFSLIEDRLFRNGSGARAVSPDGAIVVGAFSDDQAQPHAYLWSEDGGATSLDASSLSVTWSLARMYRMEGEWLSETTKVL